MPSLAKISILTLKPLHSFARSISRKTVNPIISKVDIKPPPLCCFIGKNEKNLIGLSLGLELLFCRTENVKSHDYV